MLAMIAYMMAAASALAAAVLGLVILLGGSAHLGKETAIAADKALQSGSAPRGTEVGAATAKSTGTTTGTAATATPSPPPAAAPTRKAGKSASAQRKKRNAAPRNAHRN